MVSTRTPEGWPARCPVCNADVCLEAAQPAHDAPCPHCGHLLWFFEPEVVTMPGTGVYALIRRLGHSATGDEDWAARDAHGHAVCIKLVGGDWDPARAARQEQVLARFRRLRHPYLLALEGWCLLPERLILVTELADASLADRLQAYRQAGQSGIPARELLPRFREVAEALDYLHGQGIIHRDSQAEQSAPVRSAGARERLCLCDSRGRFGTVSVERHQHRPQDAQ